MGRPGPPPGTARRFLALASQRFALDLTLDEAAELRRVIGSRRAVLGSGRPVIRGGREQLDAPPLTVAAGQPRSGMAARQRKCPAVRAGFGEKAQPDRGDSIGSALRRELRG